MSDDRQINVLRQILDAFNRHDLAATMTYFAEGTSAIGCKGLAPQQPFTA